MSTKRERSNRDADDHKRQGQNSGGEASSRGAHASSNADKSPAKSSGPKSTGPKKVGDSGTTAKEPQRGAK